MIATPRPHEAAPEAAGAPLPFVFHARVADTLPRPTGRPTASGGPVGLGAEPPRKTDPALLVLYAVFAVGVLLFLALFYAILSGTTMG